MRLLRRTTTSFSNRLVGSCRRTLESPVASLPGGFSAQRWIRNVLVVLAALRAALVPTFASGPFRRSRDRSDASAGGFVVADSQRDDSLPPRAARSRTAPSSRERQDRRGGRQRVDSGRRRSGGRHGQVRLAGHHRRALAHRERCDQRRAEQREFDDPGMGDVLDPTDRPFSAILAGGTTTANIPHGSANWIGGRRS